MNTLRAREGAYCLLMLYAWCLPYALRFVLYSYSPGVFLTLCTAPGLHTFYAKLEHDTPPGFMHSVFSKHVFPGQPVFLYLGLHNTYYQPLYSDCIL